MESKKIVLPAILAVITLIALVAGATYAYFAVSAVNNFGTSTINATAEQVGTVALEAGDSLTLSVDAVDMAKQNSDVNYFAVPVVTSGTQAKYETTQSQAPVIGTATVTGNGTFNCNYTLVVTPSYSTASMLYALSGMSNPEPTTGQLILSVNGTNYDLYTLSTNSSGNILKDSAFGTAVALEIPGTFPGIKDGTSSTRVDGHITAQLKLINKTSESSDVAHSQNDLAGTDLTLTFSIKPNTFTCTAVNS